MGIFPCLHLPCASDRSLHNQVTKLSEQVDFHSFFLRILTYVTVWPPEKSKVISILFTNNKLMERFLYVTCNSVRIFPEPAQNTDQTVGQVRSTEQMFIK